MSGHRPWKELRDEVIRRNPDVEKQLMLLAEVCPICGGDGPLFVPYGEQIACLDCVAKENGENNGQVS